VALIAIFAVLLVIIARMPQDNPLRMLLAALSHRIGVTGGLMLVDPITTSVPLAGEVFTIGSLIFLAYYWYTFFKQLPAVRQRKAPSGIEQRRQ
jgi:hypothetical protein